MLNHHQDPYDELLGFGTDAEDRADQEIGFGWDPDEIGLSDMTLTDEEIRDLKAENLRLREFIEEVARCQDSTGKAATALLTELGY